MATYLILSALSRKEKIIPAGQRSRLEWLSNKPDVIAKLERAGAIRRIESPPLAELRGWQRRAQRLSAVGIETLEQFLEASDEKILAAFKGGSRASVARWRAELESWFDSGAQQNRG